jgi:hypothetical protein
MLNRFLQPPCNPKLQKATWTWNVNVIRKLPSLSVMAERMRVFSYKELPSSEGNFTTDPTFSGSDLRGVFSMDTNNPVLIYNNKGYSLANGITGGGPDAFNVTSNTNLPFTVTDGIKATP